MRIMTYNILDGGQDRLNDIITVVKKASPDVLIVNEANGFDADNSKVLKSFAERTNFPHYHLEKCGDGWVYHTVILSKKPITSVNALRPVTRCVARVGIQYDNAELTVVALHLSPFSEKERLQEISLLVPLIEGARKTILAGDFNSLAVQDKLSSDQVIQLPDGLKKKFTAQGKPQYKVYKTLSDISFVDTAQVMKDFTATAPTLMEKDALHPAVRLDRILVSPDLADNIISYGVIENPTTGLASDHYPVIVELTVPS